MAVPVTRIPLVHPRPPQSEVSNSTEPHEENFDLYRLLAPCSNPKDAFSQHIDYTNSLDFERLMGISDPQNAWPIASDTPSDAQLREFANSLDEALKGPQPDYFVFSPDIPLNSWDSLTFATLMYRFGTGAGKESLPNSIWVGWDKYFDHPEGPERMVHALNFAEENTIRPLVAEMYYRIMVLDPDAWKRLFLTPAQRQTLAVGYASYAFTVAGLHDLYPRLEHECGRERYMCETGWVGVWQAAVHQARCYGGERLSPADIRGFLSGPLLEHIPAPGLDEHLDPRNPVEVALGDMQRSCWDKCWEAHANMVGKYNRVDETMRLFELEKVG